MAQYAPTRSDGGRLRREEICRTRCVSAALWPRLLLPSECWHA